MRKEYECRVCGCKPDIIEQETKFWWVGCPQFCSAVYGRTKKEAVGYWDELQVLPHKEGK